MREIERVRVTERECVPVDWFVPQMPTRANVKPAWQGPTYLAWLLGGCTLAGSWTWEQSQDSNSGALMGIVGRCLNWHLNLVCVCCVYVFASVCMYLCV